MLFSYKLTLSDRHSSQPHVFLFIHLRPYVYANKKNNHAVRKPRGYRILYGGDKEDRTPDLLHAMQALSQLSYTPMS